VTDPLRDIRIGTLVKASGAYVKAIIPHGFECIQPTWWQHLDTNDLPTLAKQIKEAIGDAEVTIPSIGIYGNPLGPSESNQRTLQGVKDLIEHAPKFGTGIVACFAGRVPGTSIPESLAAFKKFWGEMARRAADNGLKIAFEACAMGGNWKSGDWNIAHTPDAWEMMFNELPNENLGLEWEPCHQQIYLIDPLPQIRKWAKKIFHIHGKDATVRWDVVREHGVHGKEEYVYMRHPGFGDANWTDIISELRRQKWTGAIDIEGWHDAAYGGELEMTGQIASMQYLKRCRGGEKFVPNP